MNDYCIIGSGPSAVAAAVVLAPRNLPVTMIDPGRTLTSGRLEVVRRMATQQPTEWALADLTAIREGVEASANGIPLKRLFGSDFAFDMSGSGLDLSLHGAGVRPSYALGGLSNVWGAGMLPLHKDDLEGWPSGTVPADSDYAQVLSYVPLCGAHDDLERDFPLHTDRLLSLNPTAQGMSFLNDAMRAKPALAQNGITVGQSRLAVKAGSCLRCGLCLYGCPRNLIWNSAEVVGQLKALSNFRYEPGFVVERLQESDNRVEILGHDLATGLPRRHRAARVLLGAGAVSSTAILLASMEESASSIRMADSFYFLLPLVRFAGVRDPAKETLHTLAQAFIVMRKSIVSSQSIHFSVYGFNDLMIPSLQASLGVLGSALASRALVAGGGVFALRSLAGSGHDT